MALEDPRGSARNGIQKSRICKVEMADYEKFRN